MSNTTTLGGSIGRGLGYTAAAVIHGGAVAASYTGRFGRDIATGAVDSYVDNHARFSAMRAAAAEQRGLVPVQRSAAIETVKKAKAAA